MGTESRFYKEILLKLDRLMKRESALSLVIGVQAFLLITILVFTSFSFLEMILNHSSLLRTLIVSIIGAVSLGTFIFLLLPHLLRYLNLKSRKNYFETAGRVGENFPFIKDDLLNAMQLVSTDSLKSLYSPLLIDAAFKNVYDRTREYNFESIVNFRKAKELFLYFAGIMVFCILLFLMIPSLQAASFRIINFTREFVPPPIYTFEIHPGNSEITKGDDLLISVKITGPKPGEVKLGYKSEEQTGFEEIRLIPDSTGTYKSEQKSLRNSIRYYASADNIKSEEFYIKVIDRPVIKTMTLGIKPPLYSGIPPMQQKDNGNITALKGSSVSLKLVSTRNLRHARLMYDDSTETILKINSNQAEGNFRLSEDKSYRILLNDENQNENINPVAYSIKVLSDAYPSIELITPDGNVTLGNDNRLPLYLKITDDFGFTKLLLYYRLSASRYEPEEKEYRKLEITVPRDDKELNIDYIWNLSPLSLGTDDVITYFLEISDNDNVSGPKSARTSAFTIRVPSLDEILAKADEVQSEAGQELSETLKEAEELQKDLEKIDQELKQDKKELTWEEKQKIEKALDKYEELQNKVDEVSEQLQQVQQELNENQLLSKETLEKYIELRELMSELTSDEMKKVMEQMRNLLQELNRQQTQDALQNLKIDEERFKKSIERTMNLLKRIQVEQKIDELVKMSENLLEKQEEVNKETEESPLAGKKEREQLSSRQDEITGEMKDFSRELEELQEKMNELRDVPKEELERARENFKNEKNEELSEQASRQIQQNQKQMALQQQTRLSQNMQKMKNQIGEMKNSMMQMNQMQTFTDMMKILDNLLTLSKQQEELKKESENFNNPGFQQNTQKQNNLARNLDRIIEQMSRLSQKTFAITPEMGKALGDARREMMKSVESMQNRNQGMSALSQSESMSSLNEAASLMKGSMEAMMQGGGQGGMMSLMQQLNQMSGQQMSLNNMTQMLKSMQQGELSAQQQAELQRLGQQQEVIKKSLEQLNREARESGKSKNLSGNLENILDQMQDVISDMNTEKLNDQLIQKQERILSKLLDAQRSINERDFEKERESKTGENIVRESPAGINFENNRDKIREELNRTFKEGYLKDYELLIRKYFEAVQKENVNSKKIN